MWGSVKFSPIWVVYTRKGDGEDFDEYSTAKPVPASLVA